MRNQPNNPFRSYDIPANLRSERTHEFYLNDVARDIDLEKVIAPVASRFIELIMRSASPFLVEYGRFEILPAFTGLEQIRKESAVDIYVPFSYFKKGNRQRRHPDTTWYFRISRYGKGRPVISTMWPSKYKDEEPSFPPTPVALSLTHLLHPSGRLRLVERLFVSNQPQGQICCFSR